MNGEIYLARRKKLLSKMKENSVAIFMSNPPAKFSNDVNHVYRQNSDLFYLSGFCEPETYLIIEKNEKKNKSTLFVPPKDKKHEIWEGRRYGAEKAKEVFKVDSAQSNEKIFDFLKELLVDYEIMYYQQQINSKSDKVVLEAIKLAKQSKTRTRKGPYIMIDAAVVVEEMRLIKSEFEISQLKKAAKITKDAHIQAMRQGKPGMYEYELEAIYLSCFYKNGARRPAYSCIVASGINGTILHYTENTDKIKENDLILADCGSEYNYYASDVTRTWPISGQFSSAQRSVYELVLSTQKTCISMCKPGVKFKDIYDTSKKLITIGLVKLGLLSGDPDKLFEEKAYDRFYMHGLGHWLGIDTHDTFSISINNSTLQKGMVITIEPGIYIRDTPDIPEEFKGIAVRIEDDILITETGNENLSEGIPREVNEIEQLVQTG